MSTAVQPVAPAWTTPQILQTGLVAVWIASALLMIAAITGARSHRHAVQVIGIDAAPSIIAAQHIRSALADMDANAANELLGGAGARAARAVVEKRRTEAVTELVKAAKNITFGDDELKPIETLAIGMGTYAAAGQTAREKNSIPDWRAAANVMDSVLLPAAEALDRANRQALEAAYEKQRSASVKASVLLAIAALAAGGILVAMQIFLAGRMRRILNPGLFLATLTAFLFVVYAGQRFVSSDRDLKTVKQDAFDSISALLQARALAYSANGDESRYLLDPERAAAYEKEFNRKADDVANVYLIRERNNVTFEGEAEAAEDTIKAFAKYRGIDKQIRALAVAGRRADAIALCTGSGPNESNGAFESFDQALERALKINEGAFDTAVKHGLLDLSNFEISAPIAAVMISVLAWLGLRPRLKEYAG
jgi:hypothetical protein